MSRRRTHKGFRKKPIDSPGDATIPRRYYGVCSTHGITCAVCGRVDDWKSPFASATWARRYARMMLWTYLPRWGWVCQGCHREFPEPELADKAAKNRTGTSRRKDFQKVQVQIRLFDD